MGPGFSLLLAFAITLPGAGWPSRLAIIAGIVVIGLNLFNLLRPWNP
jgi:hypothetical protein